MKDQRSLEFTRDHAKMRRIYAGGKGPPYPRSRRGVGKEGRKGAARGPKVLWKQRKPGSIINLEKPKNTKM